MPHLHTCFVGWTGTRCPCNKVPPFTRHDGAREALMPFPRAAPCRLKGGPFVRDSMPAPASNECTLMRILTPSAFVKWHRHSHAPCTATLNCALVHTLHATLGMRTLSPYDRRGLQESHLRGLNSPSSQYS